MVAKSNAKPVKKTRRVREREARVTLIRETAVSLFAQNGYTQTTMEMVAEKAELGKATLYYYFKTKQELFTDIIEHETKILQQLIKEHTTESSSPLTTAEAICRFWVEHFTENKDLAALLLPLMAGGPHQGEAKLSSQTAQKIMAAHSPLMQALKSVTASVTGGQALVPLMVTVMLGLASKAGHGGNTTARQEIDLFFKLIRSASEMD